MRISKLLKYGIIGVLVLALVVIFGFSEWVIEYWWLDELGYPSVFWSIKGTQLFLLAGAFVISFLYLAVNAWTFSHNLKFVNMLGIQVQNKQLDLSDPKIKKNIRRILLGLTAVLCLFFSFAFFAKWDTYFRFHWSEMAGQVDPIFGHDFGFYMFRLPFIELVQSSLTALFFIVSMALVIAYVVIGLLGFEKERGLVVAPPARKHLSLNLAGWLALMAWGIYLDRYDLLFDSSGVVYGPGYTDMHIVLPVLWILLFGTVATAIYTGAHWFIQHLKGLVFAGGGLLLITFLGRLVIPSLYQSFVVQPNELKKETPYLEHNIKLTREGYNLNKVNEQQYNPKANLQLKDIKKNSGTIDNIRLWDPRLLIQTYRQLQEIRLYYQFYSVDIDRYQTDEGLYQMMLAGRELDSDLPDRANTWVNRHLQYTHGYGLVMSLVAEEGQEGIPNLALKDIPPVNEMGGLEVTRPEIYYGSEQPGYKFVNTGIEELDYPAGDENKYINYKGDGGMPVNNFFRRLLFAWNQGDINILLSDYIREDSRFQLWRNVQERVNNIAPFLRLDKDPYLTLHNGQLYWMQDAYTTSDYFPYSEPYEGRYNYIRNSVKVVVNAYNGAVDFYVVDNNDPVIRVYQDIFPELFKPVSAMPGGLRKHMRYPQDIFEVQIDIYASYHMTDPQVYYNNEDLWKRPKEKYGNSQIEMKPYYLLTKLPGMDKLEYIQIYPMTPNQRDNMIGWIAARSDEPNYGELLVYKLPKDRLIYGPIQVDSRIDQNPEISQLLSLWDQRGSRVIRGNLMVIPIEESFIYVEPVFLISEGVDIPQLQRVIVAYEDRVAMHRTLDESLEAIFNPEKPLVDTKAKDIETEPVAVETDTVQQPTQATQTADTLTKPTEFDREKVQKLWQEAKQHLKEGDWEAFGRKMDELEQVIEEGA